MKGGQRDVAGENKALLMLTAKSSMKQRLIEEGMREPTAQICITSWVCKSDPRTTGV